MENFKCFYYTRGKFLWYSLNKRKFSFYLIVYAAVRASDVITIITKQNMNVLASMFSAQHVKHWRERKKNQQIKIILLPKYSLHSN